MSEFLESSLDVDLEDRGDPANESHMYCCVPGFGFCGYNSQDKVGQQGADRDCLACEQESLQFTKELHQQFGKNGWTLPRERGVHHKSCPNYNKEND